MDIPGHTVHHIITEKGCSCWRHGGVQTPRWSTASGQLRPRSTVPSVPPKAADGSLLSDRVSVVSQWKEHFCNLLNCPLHDPPDVLVAEAEAAIPDADIDTRPPTAATEETRLSATCRCIVRRNKCETVLTDVCRTVTSLGYRGILQQVQLGQQLYVQLALLECTKVAWIFL